MRSKWFAYQSRKGYAILVVLVLASLALAACGGQSVKSEGEVAIVAWPGYIERGANDPAYNWVTQFEQVTGCKVTVKDAATSDEMVQLMNSGGYDLVTASGDASLRLIMGETVQEVDITRIPSYNQVDSRLQNVAAWIARLRERPSIKALNA